MHFQVVAVRLLCEKWYLFLYSWVFYTVNHLDIYRYVYYTYMFWWNPFFFDEKKKTKKNNNNNNKNSHISFHQSLPVWIKQIIACKPLSAAVCCFKESFTIKWKKSCQTNNQHLYSRIFVWKIQIVLNINWYLWQGDFVEDILFELKIKKLPHRFTHRLFVCLFLSEDSASGF